MSDRTPSEHMEDGLEPIDHRLVRKGIREPIVGLVDQVGLSAALAREHATELAAYGWSAEDTAALERAGRELDEEIGRLASQRSAALGATRDEAEAVDAAKAFIARLRAALPKVLRERQTTEDREDGAWIDRKAFAVRGSLRRSTPQIQEYLLLISGAVGHLDGELSRYFGGDSAARRLSEVSEALERANATQAMKQGGRPADTARLYQAKGRALELIEDLNRIGRIAFADQPVIAAQFDKHLIARARRKRHRHAAEPVEASALPTELAAAGPEGPEGAGEPYSE